MTLYEGWQVDAVQTVLLLLLALFIWRSTRLLDVRAHVATMEASLSRTVAELRVRQDEIMRELGGTPTQRDHGVLLANLARVEAHQESISRELHATRASQTRIEDFLLKKGTQWP